MIGRFSAGTWRRETIQSIEARTVVYLKAPLDVIPFLKSFGIGMTSDRYTTVAPRNVTGFNLSAEAKKSKGPISFVLDTVYRYSIGSRIYTLRYSLVLCVGSYSRMPVLKNVRKAKENKFKVGCRSNNSFLAGNVPIFLLLLFFVFCFLFFAGFQPKTVERIKRPKRERRGRAITYTHGR